MANKSRGAATRERIVRVMWAIGGLAVGATGAILVTRWISSDWVEAAGTWFGGVATVLALLWAVQTFRADQQHRESEREQREAAKQAAAQEREAEKRAEEEKRELEVRAEARRVLVALHGGGGQGRTGDMHMTSLRVNLMNNSSRPVMVTDIKLNSPLQARQRLREPVRVDAAGVQPVSLDVEPIRVDDHLLSGTVLTQYSAVITFIAEGTTWIRDSSESTPRAAGSDS